jgi:hypothetical protein
MGLQCGNVIVRSGRIVRVGDKLADSREHREEEGFVVLGDVVWVVEVGVPDGEGHEVRHIREGYFSEDDGAGS